MLFQSSPEYLLRATPHPKTKNKTNRMPLRPLRLSDFSDMFPSDLDVEDEEGVHPAARYYVVAGARTAPETVGATEGGAGADANADAKAKAKAKAGGKSESDEELGLFRSVPLSFRAIDTLFRSMPRVRKALAAELADALQEDPEGADAEVPMFPRRYGESDKAYSRRLLKEAWPTVWEKTARAAYETSHGFESEGKQGTRFRWDVRRMVLEKRDSHPRQVHKLTLAQAMSRLHNLYNHVLRKLPKQLRYTLVPMSRPRGGVDPLESAGTYGYVSLPLDDFSPERLSDSRWRPVPATQMGQQRSFGFRFVGQGGVPKLMGGSDAFIGDEGHAVDDLQGNNKEMEMSGGLVPDLDVAALPAGDVSGGHAAAGDVTGGLTAAAQTFPLEFMEKLKSLAKTESKLTSRKIVAEQDHEEMVGDFVVRVGGKKGAGAGGDESSTESESDDDDEVSVEIEEDSSSSDSDSEYTSESEDEDDQFEDASTSETSQQNSNEYTLPQVLFGLLAPNSGLGKSLKGGSLGETVPDGSVAPSLLSNLSALENFARH